MPGKIICYASYDFEIAILHLQQVATLSLLDILRFCLFGTEKEHFCFRECLMSVFIHIYGSILTFCENWQRHIDPYYAYVSTFNSLHLCIDILYLAHVDKMVGSMNSWSEVFEYVSTLYINAVVHVVMLQLAGGVNQLRRGLYTCSTPVYALLIAHSTSYALRDSVIIWTVVASGARALA